MPKIITQDEKRSINLQVRINKQEKEKLDTLCKALNLTYTEFFLISLDNSYSLANKLLKSGKEND